VLPHQTGSRMVAEAAPLKQRTKGHVATASGGTDRKSCYCAPLLTQEARMPEAIQTHATRGPSHPLIESNRIEGTRVFAKDSRFRPAGRESRAVRSHAPFDRSLTKTTSAFCGSRYRRRRR
jgi:hypothetical protein